MKLFLSGIALLLSATSLPASAQTPDITGAQIFTRDCAGCHAPSENTRAPSLQMLSGLPPRSVVTALTTGRMVVEGKSLSESQRSAVAEFVTGRAITDVYVPERMASQCTSSSPIAGAMTQPGWNGWGAGLANRRFQTAEDAGLDVVTVPRLTLAWAFGFADALAARTQPAVIGDWLFTAGDDGTVFALDTDTGCTRWTFKAAAAVRTAMSVAEYTKQGATHHALVFGDGQARVYGLDAESGSLLWMRKIDEHANATITGAPAVYMGRVYVPTSAAGEEVRGSDADYACCTFRGSVSALDLVSGEILWKSYAIEQEPAPRGTSASGVELFGPAGAGIWGTPTVDTARGLLYVGTGNGFAGPAQPTTNAIIAMDLATGAQRWVQQTVPGDIWLYRCDAGNAENPNCPETQGPDFDFGTAPLLTTDSNGRDLLIVPQKSGVLYALDPAADGAIVWEYRIGEGSAFGAQWGAAADGMKVYTGVSDTLGTTPGGMYAITLATGQRAWFSPPQPKLCEGGAEVSCYSAQGGAVTAIPGVVFSGGSDGGVRAYSASDGSLLWVYDTNRYFDTVNKVLAKGATIDGSGPVVASGMLFVNSGYNGIVGRAGNVLLAFRIE